MSLFEKRKFTFTWQIQNFSMCPQKLGEKLKSPVFVVDTLKESEWYLELYPRGKRNEGIVSCYLSCHNLGHYTDDIKIRFTLTYFSSDIEKTQVVENHTFKRKDGFGYTKLVTRDVILNDKDAFLSNEIFTLKCSLWGMDDSDSEKDPLPDVLNKEIFALASKDYLGDSGRCDECSVITRVPVQRKTVYWPIRSFSSIISNRRLTKRVHSALKDEPSFFLTVYMSIDNQRAEIEIRRLKTESMERTFVKCKISVIHAPKSARCFAVDEHFFEPNVDRVWKFPSFLELREFQENKYLHQTYDVLHLRFEFAFSKLDYVHHVERDSSKNKFKFFKNVSHSIDEFGEMYRGGELFDMKLRVGDREFKVHKIILRARSPVFRAMFDCDMKEKGTGVVDITDVDPDTLDRMLDFMYTNVMENLQVADAVKLYSAADKYQVLPLKLRCAWVLGSTLSVSNVCKVLSLVDLHHDEYLLDSAESFIHANSVEIFKSQQWEEFMKCNGTVAAKVMHKLLVN